MLGAMTTLTQACFAAAEAPVHFEYLFSQQLNSCCYTMPMMNLYILDNLRLGGNPDNLFRHATWGQWKSRREWLGENIQHYYPWMHMARNAGDPEIAPHLNAYIAEGLKKGPILPHFYDEAGNFAFALPNEVLEEERLPTKNEFERLIMFNMIPYFFIDMSIVTDDSTVQGMMFKLLDLENLPSQVIKLSLGYDATGYQVYSTVTKRYEPLHYHGEISTPLEVRKGETASDATVADLDTVRADKTVSFYSYSALLDRDFSLDDKGLLLPGFTFQPYTRLVHALRSGIYENYEFNPHDRSSRTLGSVYLTSSKEYGFNEIAQLPYTPFSFSDPVTTKEYAPFGIGLYKLMLLTMGLDEKNNRIVDRHPLYGVHQDLVAMVDDPRYRESNMWSSKYLSKERFLPYLVAQVLKKDAALKEKLKKVVDLGAFARWELYNHLVSGHYFNRDGERIAGVKFLPGEEQMLTYILCKNVRLMWYGIMNEKAFYEETIDDAEVRGLARSLGISLDFDSYVGWFYEEKAGVSLMSVWHEIKNKVIELAKPRMNFISFEDHGWVVCFDPQLIRAQASLLKRNRHYKTFMELGFTGIESDFSKEFNSFYKRPRNAASFNPLAHQRAQIREVAYAMQQLVHANNKGIELDNASLEAVRDRVAILMKQARDAMDNAAKSLQKGLKKLDSRRRGPSAPQASAEKPQLESMLSKVKQCVMAVGRVFSGWFA